MLLRRATRRSSLEALLHFGMAVDIRQYMQIHHSLRISRQLTSGILFPYRAVVPYATLFRTSKFVAASDFG